MRPLTRAEGAIRWIEYWCAQPDGSPVRLTSGQRLVLNQIYGPGPHEVSVDP